MEGLNERGVDILLNGSQEDCTVILNNFHSRNEKDKNFPGLSFGVKRDFYDAIFSRLKDPATPPSLVRHFLSALRILCREKSTLEEVLQREHVETILHVSGLQSNGTTVTHNHGYPEMLEGLKVLFNMIFQSSTVRAMFVSHGLLEALASNIQTFPASQAPAEIKYFTMRTLFIITALCQEAGPRIRNELDGLTYITDYLELLSQQLEPFEDEDVDLICETLKVLYNLIHDIVPNKNDMKFHIIEQADLQHLIKVTQLVRLYLLHSCRSREKKNELDSHSIDLLAAVSCECFSELIFVANDATTVQYDGQDMSVIEVIASFLHQRLEQSPRGRSLTEALSPVLCVLVRMSGSIRVIRKYLKNRVLPPLTQTDLMERPEIGNTLRNKLCALLTSPSGYVTELVSTFLFILVKENVKRLVKYTGFGNAAGLLANRGLLLGGKSNSGGNYSSESEESDTEEYKQVSHLINGVEGCIQPERPSPCDGMTEEQKEVEAMKLVQAIDKLNRHQLIQPVHIGPDGRTQPLDHVCQLLEHSNLSSDSLIRSYRRSDTSDSE